MKKSLQLFLFGFILLPFSALAQEELSGPPAIFSVEQHENLEGEDIALPFLEGAFTSGAVSATHSALGVSNTVKELIEDEEFVATLRFVNRRSNRVHDMVFDSKEATKQQQVDEFITAVTMVKDDKGLNDVSQTSTRTSQTVDEGQVYKNMQVQVKRCLQNHQDVYGNDIAFVQVRDISSSIVTFEGWLYKKRPSVHVFEHPVYSLYLTSCEQ